MLRASGLYSLLGQVILAVSVFIEFSLLSEFE